MSKLTPFIKFLEKVVGYDDEEIVVMSREAFGFSDTVWLRRQIAFMKEDTEMLAELEGREDIEPYNKEEEIHGADQVEDFSERTEGHPGHPHEYGDS